VMQYGLWTRPFQQNFFSGLDFKTKMLRQRLITKTLQAVLPKQARTLWKLNYNPQGTNVFKIRHPPYFLIRLSWLTRAICLSIQKGLLTRSSSP
jgi:hypothetical protein